jgi:hypothetical protein
MNSAVKLAEHQCASAKTVILGYFKECEELAYLSGELSI